LCHAIKKNLILKLTGLISLQEQSINGCHCWQLKKIK